MWCRSDRRGQPASIYALAVDGDRLLAVHDDKGDRIQRHSLDRDEAWANRGRRSDARAASRGDVLPPDSAGRARYPRYVDRCSGAHVWDVDGNRYIDYLLGYGPVILGHAHPDVNSAAMAELERGHCFAPLWSPRQVELAEVLCGVIPGAEAVLLLKTGSDATTAAVRLARIFTGRERVLRWGYNGWHDWSVHQAPGVPPMSRAEEFDLDDLDDLDRRMTKADPIACVVTMPFEYEQSRPGHLEQVRTIVHSHGALLVLDEMRSGFRLSLGGAQDYLGVRADLTTFSKAMANGYAISAVTGSAEIMAGLASTKISSTFFANPADMAAALTTIHILAETDALDRIWTFGTSLIAGLREIVAEAGIPAEVVGYPPMPFLRFTHADADESDLARLTFFSETTKRGVLLHPDHQWFVSAAHSVADLDKTLSACRRGLLAAAAI